MKVLAIILIISGSILCFVPVIRNWGKVDKSNIVLSGIDEMYFGGFVGMVYDAARAATKSREDKIIGCTGFCLVAAGMIWELC